MNIFGWKSAGRDAARPVLSARAWNTGVLDPVPRSYEAQVREGYLANAIAQRSVRLLADGAGEAPLLGAPAAVALATAHSGGQTLLATLAAQLLLHGKAIRTGSLGFEDFRKVALAALSDIAAAALQSVVGGGSAGGGATGGLLGTLAGLFGGAPGRATGGPVSPQRPYMVGERGPELFVPTASGSIAAAGGAPARDVRVSITVNGGGDAPQALAASSRQVARAVRAALNEGA